MIRYLCPRCGYRSHEANFTYSYYNDSYVKYVSCCNCGEQIGFVNYDDEDSNSGEFQYLKKEI
jgi:hypothetical protein